VDKIASIGTSFSTRSLVISASSGGYENTNYALDNVRLGSGYPFDFGPYGDVVSIATNGLIANGASPGEILYDDGVETLSNGVQYNLPHITNAMDIAAYICWGEHSTLGPQQA